MTLSNKHILLLAIFILLFALGGYYFLFSVIESKNKNAFLLSQEIDTYAQSESTRTQSDGVVEEQKDKIAEVGLYFLHKNEVVPFIEMVEDSGRKTGVVVTIGTVGVGLGDGVGENAMLKMRFEARGSWSNVNRFISYIENLPYKVALSKVDVTSASSVSQFFANAGASGSASAGASDVGKKTATAKTVVAPVWNATIEMSVLTLQ